MAFKTSKGKEALFTEINITPLTDIFLVLLIIMMVIAPTFQSNDSSIKMPEINSGLNVEQKNATISVTKDGSFFVNGTQIQEDDIYNQLIALKPTIPVFIKPSSDIFKSNELPITLTKGKFIPPVIASSIDAALYKPYVAALLATPIPIPINVLSNKF